MAAVTVEFGATDTGLKRTLDTIQKEINKLETDVRSGELSFKDLQNTWRKIEQNTRLATNIRQVDAAVDEVGDQAEVAANQFQRLDKEMDDIGRNVITASNNTGKLKDAWVALSTKLVAAYAAVQAFRGAFDFTNDAVKRVADLNETIDKTKVVFGSATQSVLDFSENSVEGLQMTKQQSLDAASTFGVFAKSAKLSADESVQFSTRLTTLAADLASLYDTNADEAIIALGAALRGENEPIRKFGVLLNDATLKASALEMGLISTTKNALTPQQKVLAAYNEVLKQTAIAHGNLKDTSESQSNEMKKLGVQWAELKRGIGEVVSGPYSDIVRLLNDAVIPALNSGVIAVKAFSGAIGAAIIEAKNVINAFNSLADRTDWIGSVFRAANESLSGFNKMMHDFFTTFTPFGYVMQSGSNAVEEYNLNLAETQKEAEKTKGKISSLTDGMSEEERAVIALEESLGLYQEKTKQSADAAEGLQAKIDPLTGKITVLKTEVEDTTEKLSYAEIALGDLTNAQAALEVQTESTKNELALLKNKIDEFKEEDGGFSNLNLPPTINTGLQEANTNLGLLDENAKAVDFSSINNGVNGLPPQLEAMNNILEDTNGLWGEQRGAVQGVSEELQNVVAEENKRYAVALQIKQIEDEINSAIQNGDIYQQKQLENQKAYNELLQEGLGKFEGNVELAKNYANKWIAVRGEVFNVNDLLQQTANMKISTPAEELHERSKEAREELADIVGLVGVDLKNASEYDVLMALGLDPSKLEDRQSRVEALEGAAKKLGELPETDLTPIVDELGTTTKLDSIKTLLNDIPPKDVTPTLDVDKVQKNAADAMSRVASEIASGSATIPPVQAKVVVDQNQVKGAIQSMVADIQVNCKGGQGGTGGDGGTAGDGGDGGDAITDTKEIIDYFKDWKVIIETIRDRLPSPALI